MGVDFEKFPKIPRLTGLRMTVTEKIDGTNAQINVPDFTQEELPTSSALMVGSRNRWITPGKGTDNYQFAQWVQNNEEILRRLGPGRHYGEWWGLGIGRHYNLSQRRFYLFNVHRWKDGLPEGLAEIGVGLVPVLYEGVFSQLALEQSRQRLIELGSVAAPGFMQPEGLVIQVNGLLWKDVFDKQGPSPEETSDEHL